MIPQIVSTAIFLFVEAILLFAKHFCERLANQFFAVQQMSITSGYQYDYLLRAIESMWFCTSFLAAVIFVLVIIFQFKNKERENEED